MPFWTRRWLRFWPHRSSAKNIKGFKFSKLPLPIQEKRKADQEQKEKDRKRCGLDELASGWSGSTEEYWEKASELGLQELRRHIAEGAAE